jgi:hypothetical protein
MHRTYFWNPGPDAAPSMEDSSLITRWFPSVEAWGDSTEAYENGDMAEVEAGVSSVMDCSTFRLYLDYSFYRKGWKKLGLRGADIPLYLMIAFHFFSRLMYHVIFSKGDNPNTSLKVL